MMAIVVVSGACLELLRGMALLAVVFLGIAVPRKHMGVCQTEKTSYQSGNIPEA